VNGTDQQAKITEAAIRLHAANKRRCIEITPIMQRRNAADVGRACGLVIQCPGSEDNPNATVEAIIAATDALAQTEVVAS